MKLFNTTKQYVFGGYNKNEKIRFESTSGGAFSAIVDAFCDKDYVIFGAIADHLDVYHTYITDKKELSKFRKSKYSQSKVGKAYTEVKCFLKEGKKVLFSGTPCQIAALKMFLQNTDTSNLLTVEVICEGVPSPLYIKKYEKYLQEKYGKRIDVLDYRYTGKSCLNHGKWDFQIMRTTLEDREKEILIDRWFNPFWSIWLAHLMSRPSCYECKFTRQERVADISLGDLWGIHLYCPELYGNNYGTSLIFSNSEKGYEILLKSQANLYGHELDLNEALKYQGPMKRPIAQNPKRTEFMNDLRNVHMSYKDINRKWARRPTLKLLWQKYIWGNRQKIVFWSVTNGNYKIK